ncbi:MAG: hypothetical protein SGI89_06815 [bacterium]|nr:hypothetical protein [bacterium]
MTRQDSSHFRSFFSLFQKLDYRDRENSGKKRLAGILAAYLFSNTILSYSFSITFDERSFVILSLTSNLFLLSLIVLTDFANLFLAAREKDLFKTLPVKGSEIFTAKFISAFVFLLFFILSASIPQAVFFYLMNHDISMTIAFLLTEITFGYFATGIIVLAYVLILKLLKSRASIMISIMQVLFFVFIFYSSTLSSRSSSRMLHLRESILKYDFVNYLPQTLYSNSVYDIRYFILCVFLSFTVYLVIYLILSKNYFSLLETLSTFNKRKAAVKKDGQFEFIKKFIYRYILKDNTERAAFMLTKNQLTNSKFLRTKYIPIVFMPMIVAVIGLVSGISNLLFLNIASTSLSFVKTDLLIMSPSITFTLLMCSRLLITNTKILDNETTGTEWIYESLPVSCRKDFVTGTNKFIYVVFIVPVLLILFFLLSIKGDPGLVALNILFVGSGMYLINSVTTSFDNTYPFSLENSKFNSASKFLEIFISIILGIILLLIQIFVFQSIIFVAAAIFVFIITAILLNRK